MSDIAAASPPEISQRFCPDCGYDLQGLSSDRCPECGLAIDASLSESPIPWVHRHRIGRVRAFYRTVILATFHPKKLAAAAAVPVSYADARLFRRQVVIVASLPFIVVVAGLLIWQGRADFLAALWSAPAYATPAVSNQWQMELGICWLAGATLPAVFPLGIFVTFALVAATPSYWFHPKRIALVRQNRAVAISAYTCAPLVWLPLLGVFGGALALTKIQQVYDSPVVLLFMLAYGVSALLIAIILLMLWLNTLRVLSRTTHAGAGRLAAAGALLPIGSVLSIVAGLGFLPACIGLVWLMIDSVR